MRRWFHLLCHRIRRLVMRHRAQRAQRAYRNLRAARMETLRGLRVRTHFNARPAPFLLTKSAGGTLRLCTSLMPATPQATVSSDDAPPSTLPYDAAGGDGASAGPSSGDDASDAGVDFETPRWTRLQPVNGLPGPLRPRR